MAEKGRFGPWLAAQVRRRWVLIWIALGALSALGQAPLGWYPATLLGLALAFLGFLSTSDPRSAFKAGWLFGLGYFALTLSWIVEPFLVDVARHGWMAPFALLGMAGGLALFWGVAFWLARGRKTLPWLTWSIALTGVELARAYVLTGFPWGMVAYVWTDTPLLQLASLAGPHGLNLLTFLGVSLSLTYHHKGMIIGMLALLALAGLGAFLTPPAQPLGPDRPILRLVQPNAPQHQKWDPEWMPIFFERHLEMTAIKAARKPDLIIWPETSIPVLLRDAEIGFQRMSEASGGVPIVAGLQRIERGRLYNTLVALGSDGIVSAQYDKHHLVPFGEYIPGAGLLNGLGLYGLADQLGIGYSPGPGPSLLDLGALGQALPLICYEAVFPQDVGATEQRPDWILQLTNDAWFGEVSGPHQHLAQARFRAVEQGLPMVRVANTGISAVIDPAGRVLGELSLGVQGYLDAPLPTAGRATPYSKSGDWTIFWVLIGLTALAAFRRGQKNH